MTSRYYFGKAKVCILDPNITPHTTSIAIFAVSKLFRRWTRITTLTTRRVVHLLQNLQISLQIYYLLNKMDENFGKIWKFKKRVHSWILGVSQFKRYVYLLHWELLEGPLLPLNLDQKVTLFENFHQEFTLTWPCNALITFNPTISPFLFFSQTKCDDSIVAIIVVILDLRKILKQKLVHLFFYM